MREIKFRIWDGVVMYEPFNLIELFGVGSNYVQVVERNDLGDKVLSNGYEIMQYTGLKDKNGKEIYEGDIVKVLDRDWADKERDTKTLIVYYHHGTFELVSKEGIEELEKENPDIYNQKWITARIYKEYGRDRFEIIGNIYENPELIKK